MPATIVVLLDDSSINTAPVINNAVPSEVYFYIGKKTSHGNPIIAAGLTNGNFYGMKVTVERTPVTDESNEFGLGTAATGFIGKGRFSLHDMGNVSALTSVQIEIFPLLLGLGAFSGSKMGPGIPTARKIFILSPRRA